MIGMNKIIKARALTISNPDVRIYFFFKFTDGCYGWKYDINTILPQRLGGRCDRGRDEIKEYNYIPISLLTLECLGKST